MEPYFSGAETIEPGTHSPVRDFLGGFVPDAAWNALDRAGRTVSNKWKYGLFSDVDPIPPPETVPTSAPAPPTKSVTQRYPDTAIPGAQRISTADAAKEPPPPPARTEPRRVPVDASSFPSIEEGQYGGRRGMTADPWNPSGGARSAAQLISDTHARALLDAAYEPAYARIERDAARTDPMGHALAARRRNLEYEATMPFGVEPTLRSSFVPRDGAGIRAGLDAAGQPLYDYDQGQTGVTQGQQRDFERQVRLAQAKAFDPKAMLSVQSAAARQAELENLGEHRELTLARTMSPQDRAAAVANRQLSPQAAAQAEKMKPLSAVEAHKELQDRVLEAATRGALLDGDIRGLAALLYPHLDPGASAEEAAATQTSRR